MEQERIWFLSYILLYIIPLNVIEDTIFFLQLFFFASL